MKVARLRLGNDDLVQEVVQETLEAALRARSRFARRSSLRTWLVGIPKHKVADALRARSRRTAPRDPDPTRALFFDADGHWRRDLSAWSDPSRVLTDRQFFAVLERCLERLPKLTAQAFVLREVFEQTTPEICRELAITPNYLGVLLYRARLALRRCLELHWFET